MSDEIPKHGRAKLIVQIVYDGIVIRETDDERAVVAVMDFITKGRIDHVD